MIHQVDETLLALLRAEGAELLKRVNISFRAPDRSFPNKVTPPAINLFLYDIRENLELRSNEQMMERTGNGKKAKILPPPVRVDCSYLITAWSDADDSAREEHRFLGEVMRTLLRFPQLPREHLRGELANQALPVPTAVLHPGRLQSLGEFWQALEGQPRTALNYTITIAVQPAEAVETDVVLGTNTDIDHYGERNG